MHLGMSGSLAFSSDPGGAGAHDHFDLTTTRGTLRLTDPRRFGAVVWSPAVDAGAAAKLLAGLGLEPFDAAFTGAHLHAALRGRRVAIKQALLAGDIVVGAGNIYACEALFTAGIDPRTRSERLSGRAANAWLGSSRHAGTGARPGRHDVCATSATATAWPAPSKLHARVYGRAGQPCTVCGTPVAAHRPGQRSTFFCPTCQRR